MKKILSDSIVVLLLFYNDKNLLAAPFDSGMITSIQPNDKTFQ
jgi:hypothetical protein